MSGVDTCFYDPVNERWYSTRTGQVFPVGDVDPPPVLELGPVLFSRAEIDTWTTGSEYTALAATSQANTSWVPTDFGTTISNDTQVDNFVTEAQRAKVMAALWAVDGNAARLADVTAHLDGIKDITSFGGTDGNNKLRMSWAVPNFLVAAWIISYENAEFETFLRNVCMTRLDWPTGGNWFATFAASRLMIASYLQDETLWDDAIDYLSYHIERAIYHPDYDGENIEPITGFSEWPAKLTDLTHNESATEQHWHNGVAQTGGVYPATYGGTPYVAGTDAEVVRDLAHEIMGMHGWLQALLTIERCNGTVPMHVQARIDANVQWLAGRYLYWLVNGTLQAPAGVDSTPVGVGSEFNREAGWYTAARYYAGAVPSNVTSLLARTEVITANVVGVCHQTVERLTEKTLL